MEKRVTMKYITVLDFEIGQVFQYNIEGEVTILKGSTVWYPESESCEEFLSGVGHNLSNCEWMVHCDNEIITK